MRTMMTMVGVIVLSGCGGVSAVGYPTGGGSYHVMRTITDPHAISATQQRNWEEICHVQTHNDYTDCVKISDVQFTTSQGYISGIAGPMMYSAAIVGAGYYVGNGLSKSGGTTYNSSGSASGASAQNNNVQQNPTVNNNLNESFNGRGYQW